MTSIIQPIDSLLVRSGYEVTIGIDRDLDRTMPELLLNIGKIRAILDHEAGVRVAQCVWYTVRAPGLLEQWTPYQLEKGGWVHGLALIPGEQPR